MWADFLGTVDADFVTEGVAVALREGVPSATVLDLEYCVRLGGTNVLVNAGDATAAAVEAELGKPESLEAGAVERFGGEQRAGTGLSRGRLRGDDGRDGAEDNEA